MHNYNDCDFRYNVNTDPGTNSEPTTLFYSIASNLISSPFFINITNTLFYANNGYQFKEGADISIATNEQGGSSCFNSVHKTYLTITNSAFINTNQSNIKMDGDNNASVSILTNNRILNRIITSGVIVRRVSAIQNYCSNNTLAYSNNNTFCLNSLTTYNFGSPIASINIGNNSTDVTYIINGLVDSDKDGVYDVVDACPYDPNYFFLHTWESCNITTLPNTSSIPSSSHKSHSVSSTAPINSTVESRIISPNTIFGISKQAFVAAVSISSVVGLGLLMGGSYLIYKCAVRPKDRFKGPRNMGYEKELVT